MHIDTTRHDDTMFVKPFEGRLDSHVAAEFRSALEAQMEDGVRLVLDLSAVDFVDSSCLGTIVVAHKQLHGKGGLIVCSANDDVMRLFKLARLDRILHIALDRNEVLATPTR